MSDRKKSAKDIAFDKERAKFRSEIRNLNKDISDRDGEIRRLKEVISQKENEITERDDWIRRLLEYTELSEAELKKFIEKEKIETEIVDSISGIGNMFSRYFGLYQKYNQLI